MVLRNARNSVCRWRAQDVEPVDEVVDLLGELALELGFVEVLGGYASLVRASIG